jgi:DNA-binding IclR family transcriptional regulator
MADDAADVPVRAAVRSTEIVDLLASEGQLGVSAIATALDMPVSTVHGYLESLCAAGWLRREDGEYAASFEVFGHGQRIRRGKDYFGPARRQVDRLNSELGENVVFVALEDGRGVVLYKQRGETAPADGLVEGEATHLPSTAFGQAILANFDREDVETIVDRHGFNRRTDETITSRGELFEKLETVSDAPREGYAMDSACEQKQGIRAVAAPVVLSEVGVVGAIGVTGPYSNMSEEYFHSTIPKKVTEAANVVQLDVDEDR